MPNYAFHRTRKSGAPVKAALGITEAITCVKRAIQLRSLLLVLSVLSVKSIMASEIQYPYHAPPEREQAILGGYEKIERGMNVDEVKKVLGDTDEVHDLYEPKLKSGKKIGFTYWYLIQSLKGSGSQAERNEKLVRVSFGLDGKVSRVDRW